MELRVDEEFEALIHPLSEDERKGLERSIVTEGCRDAIVVWGGVVVDGHNRYEICQRRGVEFGTRDKDFADRHEAIMWIIDNQLSRRNVPAWKRGDLALRREEEFIEKAKERQREHGNTAPGREAEETLPQLVAEVLETPEDREANGQLGKVAGLSRESMRKVRYIKANADEGLQDALDNGEETIGGAYKRLKNEERSKERAREREEAAEKMESITLDERVQVVHADFRDALGDLPDASVDLVLTDPPYPREYLPLYSELGYMASQCLKDGGVLAAMVGQSYLPEIVERLSEHLAYHWTLAYVTPGGQSAQLWQRKVNTFWKPVLVFTNGDYAGEWFGDVARSDVNDNDKRFHHWGQSESGTADLMERLSKPGEMVVDPFVGGGTTAVVAAATGRRFLGSDLERKAIETATYRLKEMAQ